MKKIVWLYGGLMSQYGGYSALKFLQKRLESAGESVEIKNVAPGESVNLADCGLLLLPPGTERSLLAAADAAARIAPELIAYCRDGGTVLATGNAGALLGHRITSFDGASVEGLGVLDINADISPKRFYSEFIMDSSLLGNNVIGAINTSTLFSGSEKPLFEVKFDAAHILADSREGFVRDNVFATQLIGPMLVRNPAVLDIFCERLCGHELAPCEDAWRKFSEAGYESALATLQKESR